MLKGRAAFAIVTRGLWAGVLAGAVFMAFQMGVTYLLGEWPLDPLRLAATILLGPATDSFEVTMVLWVGVAVHVVLSALYGVTFWVGLASRDMLLTEPLEVMVRYGVLYATAIWGVNTLLGQFVFRQFAGVRPILFGVAHIVVFGPALMAFTGLLRDRVVSIEFDLFHAEEYRIRRLQRNSPYYEIGFEEGEEVPLPEETALDEVVYDDETGLLHPTEEGEDAPPMTEGDINEEDEQQPG